MSRIARSILGALLLLHPASGISRLQAPAPATVRATVEGFVVNSVTGQPVEGIHVAILEGGQPLSEAGIEALLVSEKPAPHAPQVTKILPAFVLGGRTLTPE